MCYALRWRAALDSAPGNKGREVWDWGHCNWNCNCGGLLFRVEVLNFHYFRFLTSSCPKGHDDYNRVIFRRDVIPSLLIRSMVFLRRQLYEQTKKSYLFSYTVSLSDFDCFRLQYFLDNENNNYKKRVFDFYRFFVYY